MNKAEVEGYGGISSCDYSECCRFVDKAYQQGRVDAESNQIVDELIKLGYPHNFQHERSDIVEYMYAVTDIIRKAYKIKEQKNDSSRID